jgi:hypothetical protein
MGEHGLRTLERPVERELEAGLFDRLRAGGRRKYEQHCNVCETRDA